MSVLRGIAALVSRGDVVEVTKGRLRITTHDGRAVPGEWMAKREEQVITALCDGLSIPVYRFLGSATGSYGRAKAGGVTLQFVELNKSASAYAIFNASLKYTRNTKHHKAGQKMKAGEFTVSKGSHFVLFWQSTALAMPERRSRFNRCMGKLSTVYITGETSTAERLDAATIRGLEITPSQVIECLNSTLSEYTNRTQAVHKDYTTSTQAEYTRETLEPLKNKALSNAQATGGFYYGKKVIREEGNTGLVKPSNKPVGEQSIGEWLQSYDEAS